MVSKSVSLSLSSRQAFIKFRLWVPLLVGLSLCCALSALASETGTMTDQTSFQFQCPSCGAVLQAALGNTLTSVQCGECNDVFDVQLPGRHARAPQHGARAFDHGRLPPS